jgi:hypothetical protein
VTNSAFERTSTSLRKGIFAASFATEPIKSPLDLIGVKKVPMFAVAEARFLVLFSHAVLKCSRAPTVLVRRPDAAT